jgi:hypothetical protein
VYGHQLRIVPPDLCKIADGQVRSEIGNRLTMLQFGYTYEFVYLRCGV